MVLALLALLRSPIPPGYDRVELDGWRLEVEHALPARHPKLWAAARAEADRQLASIARVVPDGPLARLREVTIWVHLTSPGTPCAAFHPDSGWLREHKMEPAMAGGIEIGSAANFVSWTYEQPWMLLHELAHSYHFRVLPNGFANADVAKAYAAAMAAHRYDAVLHWDGNTERAYATTNAMEYFAECTEAYFGVNDFYPFVRAELQKADPDGYALMQKVWGPTQKRLPAG